MTIREQIEQMEREMLSPYACLSVNSRGRDKEEPECDIRPVFQRDRDRILHSKAFRRLKNKTQVFLTPKGDHYRTRMSHTLEVSQNARTIAKALRLNEDSAEAMAENAIESSIISNAANENFFFIEKSSHSYP